MRRPAALAIALLLVACRAGEGEGATVDPPASTEVRLARAVEAAAHDLEISGLSLVVLMPDGSVFSSIEGVEPSIRFGVASITKMFTTVTVLRLVERGVLDLDAAVTLPGLEPGATLRDLLGHTAGLPYGAPNEDRYWTLDGFERAAAKPHPCAPQQCFSYSDLGFVAVGLVVEQATGEPFRDVLDREVLRPLALADTELAELDRGIDRVALPDGENFGPPGPLAGVPVNTWAGGALVTTAADLAHFAQALSDGQLLQPASLALMMDTSHSATLPCPDPCNRPYGLGLEGYRMSGQEAWGHGASTGSQLTVLPQEGITVAILSTRPALGAELTRRVLAALTAAG